QVCVARALRKGRSQTKSSLRRFEQRRAAGTLACLTRLSVPRSGLVGARGSAVKFGTIGNGRDLVLLLVRSDAVGLVGGRRHVAGRRIRQASPSRLAGKCRVLLLAGIEKVKNAFLRRRIVALRIVGVGRRTGRPCIATAAGIGA